MSELNSEVTKSRIWFVAAITLVALAGVMLRTWDISADLPAMFAGGSQDFTTDAAYLTLYAKTAVHHGTWDLFGFEPWSAFKISAVSGISYLCFLMFGVSRATAAAAGTVLQVAGLVLFLLGAARYLSRSALLAVAAILSTSYLLILYGRVPFSENGLLCLAGATFFVFSRWFDQAWGRALVGVLIALAALLGKSFGFLLAGGPALAILMDDSGRKWQRLLQLVLPIAIVTLAFTMLFHGESGLFGFLYEYGVSEHGTPHGLGSPQGFFEALISV